jgi:hypothetical protein
MRSWLPAAAQEERMAPLLPSESTEPAGWPKSPASTVALQLSLTSATEKTPFNRLRQRLQIVWTRLAAWPKRVGPYDCTPEFPFQSAMREVAVLYVQEELCIECPAAGVWTFHQAKLELLHLARDIFHRALGTESRARAHADQGPRNQFELALGDLERAAPREVRYLYRIGALELKRALFRGLLAEWHVLLQRQTEDGAWWFPDGEAGDTLVSLSLSTSDNPGAPAIAIGAERSIVPVRTIVHAAAECSEVRPSETRLSELDVERLLAEAFSHLLATAKGPVPQTPNRGGEVVPGVDHFKAASEVSTPTYPVFSGPASDGPKSSNLASKLGRKQCLKQLQSDYRSLYQSKVTEGYDGPAPPKITQPIIAKIAGYKDYREVIKWVNHGLNESITRVILMGAEKIFQHLHLKQSSRQKQSSK